MKIGILTFHFAHNYGAMLQAYALSTKLNMLGYDAEIIDYRLKYIYDVIEKKGALKLYGLYRRNGNGTIVALLKTIKNYFHEYYKDQKWQRFEDFLNDTMKKSKRVYESSEVNGFHYDALICGSDQIWNETLTGGLIPLYFGTGIFCPKKVSYAASNGHNDVSCKILNVFLQNIKTLDAVSVREKGLSSFLQSHGIKNTLVLDPIFLLTREEWNEIAILPKEEDYVLTYSFAESPHFFDKAIQIAELLGKPLVCFGFRKKKLPGKIKQVYDKGPREFLGYFNNACYVVTNSFHGTAFSILYQKQITVIPPIKRRERLDSLLEICNLNSLTVEDEENIKCLSAINYNEVNAILSREKKESLDFLLSILGDTK